MKPRGLYWIYTCLLMVAIIRQTTSFRWLALATTGVETSIEQPGQCEQLTGLVKRQKSICRKNIEVMDSVRYGAEEAISECQFQFMNRRWNCSTVDPQKVFGKAIRRGTRESAFVHAISAAGVAHSVTRACSSGDLNKCGCDRSVRGTSAEGFQWSGCSDNVAYGTTFSAEFVDARDRAKGARSPRSLMNLHNNNAGRMTVEENMEVECKCHGVSGSCELKTCWRAMPTFREVGFLLKEKFDGATEVQERERGSRRVLAPLNPHFKPHTDHDLVYLESSPDFCEPNPSIGSLGTQGRRCNKTSKAIDGCELMCCGRGHAIKRRTVVERCHCKFYWCCFVKCKECTKEVDDYFCE